MKKVLVFLLVTLLAAGCGYSEPQTSQSTRTNTAPTPSPTRPEKSYELYQGPVWAGSYKNCSWDLSCTAKQAETCSPAKGGYITQYTSDRGTKVTEEYQLGVQGTEFNKCQVYMLVITSDVLGKEVKANTLPIGDGNIINYIMCRFNTGADFAALLKSDQSNIDYAHSNYASFLEGTGLFHITRTSVQYYTTVAGASQTVDLPARCVQHTVLDKFNHIASVQYGLVKGEGVENAADNFRVVVQDMQWPSSAGFLVTKDGRDQTVNIAKGQEANVLGYKIKVLDFGQKNVSLNSNGDVFEPMVGFTISQ